MAAPTTRRQARLLASPAASTLRLRPTARPTSRRKTRAKAKSEALRQKEAAQVEALPVQHPHAAGIDIGSRSHWVCVGFTTEADFLLDSRVPGPHGRPEGHRRLPA